MKSLWLILFISALVLYSCNNEGSLNSSNKNTKTPLHPVMSPTSNLNPILDDLLNNYDNQDLIATIFIMQKKLDIKNGEVVVNTTGNDANAIIVNNDRTDGIDIKNNIIVNSHALVYLKSGNYLLVKDEEPFPANFGLSQNKIFIDSSDNFPGFIDSVTFVSPIMLTNISYNQNISKSQDLVINWTGGAANQLVQIVITKLDSLTIGTPSGTYVSTTNSGNSITLTKERLQAHLQDNGRYNVQIIAWDPHYFTLDNGKQICIMGESIHEVDVNVVD